MSKKKKCQKCNNFVGNRTIKCDCGYIFIIKQKKKSIIELDTDFDWRTLMPGNDIKVAQGSGPYYIWKDDNDQEVKECLGHYGWFRVNSLTAEGIHAYEIIPAGQGTVKTGGYSFLYMAKKPRIMKSGTIMVAHKIIKVKRYDHNNN